MKTKAFLSILILLCIGFMFIGGCASTGKIKEPSHTESTLLIGRIKVTCNDFPREWKINGEHTKGVIIYLVNVSTNKVTKLKCNNKYGMFCLTNPDASQYILAGFVLRKEIVRTTFTGSHQIKNTYMDIQKNSVNNLGDMEWIETYKGQQKRGGGSSWYESTGTHIFLLNYGELEDWFRETYPESAWNRKNWHDVRYKTF
jgi:hypothetical protein